MKYWPDLFTDVKIFTGYFATIATITFGSADAFLKFCLTGVVIGYTSHKWYFMYLDRKDRKKKESETQNKHKYDEEN
jgi:hypothetical protein